MSDEVGYKKPPKSKQFKKGQVANPSGKPKLSKELCAIKELTKAEINRLFAKYARMSKEEMTSALQNPSLPSLELWICSGIVNGIKNGDWYNLNLMFDRIFGRPKPQIEESTSPDTAPQVIVNLPSNGKEAITIDANIDEDQQ